MPGQFFQTFTILRIRFGQRIVSIHPLHILLTHSCNIRIRKSYSFSGISAGLNNLTYIYFLTANFKLRIGSCSVSHSAYNSGENQNLFFHVVWFVLMDYFIKESRLTDPRLNGFYLCFNSSFLYLIIPNSLKHLVNFSTA